MSFRTPLVRIAAALSIAVATPLFAQTTATAAAQVSIIGTWAGTVTIPLQDSSIVLPAGYEFTQSADSVVGTATVPGQGVGKISNLVRDGANIRFRVTMAMANSPDQPRSLEHNGKVGEDGSIEGSVSVNNQQVAKFKIAMKK